MIWSGFLDFITHAPRVLLLEHHQKINGNVNLTMQTPKWRYQLARLCSSAKHLIRLEKAGRRNGAIRDGIQSVVFEFAYNPRKARQSIAAYPIVIISIRVSDRRRNRGFRILSGSLTFAHCGLLQMKPYIRSPAPRIPHP